MDSPQISLSLGSGSSKSSGSHSSHNSVSNSNSGVQRIPRKRKRRRVRECAEAIEGDDDDIELEIDENPAGRSYVWLHFRKIKKTFYGMKDGKRVVVDEIERAQCIHCESDFACDSHSNGTSTLKRHIEISIFVKFLRIFFYVTMRISTSNHPTSWKAFHDIVAIKAEIDGLLSKPDMCTGAPIEKTLFDMASSMKIKYEKYFATLDDCNQLMFIALVLNPRYKIRNFESICKKWLKMGYVEIKKKSAEVNELMVELCDLYSSSMNVPSSSKSGKSRSGESSQSIVSQANKSSSKKSTVEATGIIKDMEEEWER